MEIITKEQLLQGKEYRETLEVEIQPGVMGAVKIRPLTYREWVILSSKRIQDIESRGAVKKTGRRGEEVKLDLSAIQGNTFKAKCELVSLAMVDPVVTPEEAGQMWKPALDKINDRIRQITGIDEEGKEEITSFRDGKRGGDEPRRSGDELSSG